MARALFKCMLAAAAALTLGAGTAADAAVGHRSTHAHAGAHRHHHHHPHVVHRANRAAEAGDRHVTHHEAAKGASFGAPVFPTPQFQSPYPYAGHLAGDGILGTGWMDSNVMRAWGVVRY